MKKTGIKIKQLHPRKRKLKCDICNNIYDNIQELRSAHTKHGVITCRKYNTSSKVVSHSSSPSTIHAYILWKITIVDEHTTNSTVNC